MSSASKSSQEWEIRNRADTCLTTGRKFEDQEPFFSRLTLTPDGYLREDYSLEAWTDELKAGAISSWKTIYRAPPPPKSDPVKKEDIETSLRDLMAKGDPASLHAIFVLAVLLERKRVLIEKDVQIQPDGRKLRVYEHKLSGEAFIVVDPDLKLNQLQEVQDEVATLLGWNAASTSPEKPGEMPPPLEAESTPSPVQLELNPPNSNENS